MDMNFTVRLAVIMVLFLIPLILIYIWAKREYFDSVDTLKNIPVWMYLALIGIIPLVIGIWVTGRINGMTLSIYLVIVLPVMTLTRLLVVDKDHEET